MTVVSSEESYLPGDIVRVGRGFYRHVGIVAPWQWKQIGPHVVSLDQRGVMCEPLSKFANGGEVRNDGAFDRSRANWAASRARQQVGRPLEYNLWSNNCEHFVREMYGLPRRSPQVETFLGSLAIVGLVVGVIVVTARSGKSA